jgi:hypothetical protein
MEAYHRLDHLNFHITARAACGGAGRASRFGGARLLCAREYTIETEQGAPHARLPNRVVSLPLGIP